MISDVEEKTYTYGMLRAMGLKNNSLKGLLTLQAFSFSIPGLIFGLAVAALLNVVFRVFLFKYAENAYTY